MRRAIIHESNLRPSPGQYVRLIEKSNEVEKTISHELASRNNEYIYKIILDLLLIIIAKYNNLLLGYYMQQLADQLHSKKFNINEVFCGLPELAQEIQYNILVAHRNHEQTNNYIFDMIGAELLLNKCIAGIARHCNWIHANGISSETIGSTIIYLIDMRALEAIIDFENVIINQVDINLLFFTFRLQFGRHILALLECPAVSTHYKLMFDK